MERPESLLAVTIADYKEVYEVNKRILNSIAMLVVTNSFIDLPNNYYESVLNYLFTELILQQEYIRECETENWGGQNEKE